MDTLLYVTQENPAPVAHTCASPCRAGLVVVGPVTAIFLATLLRLATANSAGALL